VKTISDLQPILSELPFLKGMKPEHLELMTGCAANVQFQPDEYLFKEGDESNAFYILRSGRVAIEIIAPGVEKIILQTCGEEETVGWSWLVGPHGWRYAGRAVTVTRAILFDGKCLRTKCEEDHDLGYELFKRVSLVIASRLESTRLQLLDLYVNR
jgi:CRP-like cAMP-binding protein